MIKKFVESLHEKGIPLPLLRDHGTGSLSLTLVAVSFSLAAYSIVAEKNSDSIMYALALFGMCGSLYWGKKWQIRKIGVIDLSVEEKKE